MIFGSLNYFQIKILLIKIYIIIKIKNIKIKIFLYLIKDKSKIILYLINFYKRKYEISRNL